MTTVAQIITDAYRQSNQIAVGASPSDNQNTEALRYLNRAVKSVFGNEAGDKFTSLPIGSENYSRPSDYPLWDTVPDDSDWFVPENVRVMINVAQSVNLYLSPNPDDGARFAAVDVGGNIATYPITVYGNGRTIESTGNIILNTNNTDSEWFYRADTGNWVKYASLLITDVFPFPEEFDDYFITELALRLNPSYGISIDEQTTAVYKRSKMQLRARYRQTQPTQVELGLIRMPKVAIDRDSWANGFGWDMTTQTMFNKGWPF